MDIQNELKKMAEQSYADFHKNLIPGVDCKNILGVRVPKIRAFAKEIMKDAVPYGFLEQLPHKYYDENMLHGILISEIKDFKECVELTDKFLPYVDNWAVCDSMRPKIFKKHKKELIDKIKIWAKSKEIYTCRYGIEALMSFYLDDDFKKEYLEIPASVISDEYYVNMMIAFFYATALAKQWESTIPYIENKKLSPWIHNKTIQKAVESFRITDEQKKYLRTLKRV